MNPNNIRRSCLRKVQQPGGILVPRTSGEYLAVAKEAGLVRVRSRTPTAIAI